MRTFRTVSHVRTKIPGKLFLHSVSILVLWSLVLNLRVHSIEVVAPKDPIGRQVLEKLRLGYDTLKS
jgi:hypothetical protein